MPWLSRGRTTPSKPIFCKYGWHRVVDHCETANIVDRVDSWMGSTMVIYETTTSPHQAPKHINVSESSLASKDAHVMSNKPTPINPITHLTNLSAVTTLNFTCISITPLSPFKFFYLFLHSTLLLCKSSFVSTLWLDSILLLFSILHSFPIVCSFVFVLSVLHCCKQVKRSSEYNRRCQRCVPLCQRCPNGANIKSHTTPVTAQNGTWYFGDDCQSTSHTNQRPTCQTGKPYDPLELNSIPLPDQMWHWCLTSSRWDQLIK